MGIVNLYYNNIIDAERKQSSLDDNIAWIKCPNEGSAEYTDVAVNTKTGDIFGACTVCDGEVRLNP